MSDNTLRIKAKRIWGIYRLSAKNRGIKFDLTESYFIQYWRTNCYYCGNKILEVGFDRVNNKKGYTVGNVVPCCGICNRMKSDYSVELFIEHCINIVSHSWGLRPNELGNSRKTN